MIYEATTNGLKVEVNPQFISKENQGSVVYYIYSYTVQIENQRDLPCQLISRHWIIRDGNGHDEHVVGDGVIGKQPVIYPGKRYVYRSGCPLPTPTGSMRGWYHMEDSSTKGHVFEIRIPPFFLRPSNEQVSRLHAT